MVAKKVDVLFVLLTFFFLPLLGCRNEKDDNYIRNTLSEFEQKAILFPDKMLCIENGVSRYREISISEPTFIPKKGNSVQYVRRIKIYTLRYTAPQD